MIKESKLFSEGMQDDVLASGLLAGSVSKADAEQRQKAYEQVFNNYEGLKEAAKSFSGYAETPLLSTQYFNASVTSYINSWAGFLAIERSMDSPSALLHYFDVLGVSDDRKVKPNLGVEDMSGLGSAGDILGSAVTDPASGDTTLDASKKLIPGSVKITFTNGSGGAVVAEMKDDRAGALLAGPNLLEVGTVDYASGVVTIKPTANLFTTLSGSHVNFSYVEDAPGAADNGANRFKLQLENIQVDTTPDLLIGEANIVTLAAMKKNLGIDPQSFLSGKLTEMHTQLINARLVKSIANNYVGTTVAIDITTGTTGYTDYRSGIDAFSAGLIDVDGQLAAKSTKGVKATAYVVAKDVADVFRKTKTIGLWRENTTASHIEDLVGFYDGIPVLRSNDVAAGYGYACHKTADGNAAPCMRAIFLPLTNTPAIGNYDNPAQFAEGVYYQEGARSIFTELVQKFQVTA
jgi:hypothetical protein